MATFRINELADIPFKQGSSECVWPSPKNMTIQTAITTSGTSQQSAAFAAETNYIDIICDADVYVMDGDNPTAAAATSLYVKADERMQFRVSPGEKIAVIDA